MTTNFRIEIADTKEKYEGLRALWCEVFKDEADFIDSMYESFGAEPAEGKFTSDEIAGYVGLDDDGTVVSALTCFLSGTYEGRHVWTSYAICTSPSARGKGYAGELVEYVRDYVLEQGAISLISPAELSLEDFYARHGYERVFFVDENVLDTEEQESFDFDEEDAEYEKFNPSFAVKSMTAAEYNKCREEYLSDIPHVVLGDSFMNLIYEESAQADGASGLLSVNNGDAICTLAEYPIGQPMLAELIVNPRLREISEEIDIEIARAIAMKLGADEIVYRAPGAGKCQSMAAGISDININEENSGAYYGFPVD